MTVSIFADAFESTASFFKSLPDIAEQAMGTAINQVADRDGLALLKRDMREQVDFPPGYLENEKHGLKVVRRAGKGSLEAVIRGRDRATSLARFARGQNRDNTQGRGVRITVRGGRTQTLKKAFLVTLRNGNTGLAIRLKDGESPKFTQGAVKLANNVYLLYGPSVDQVFRGVAEDRAGDLSNMVTKQFFRQFDRITNGK
jgi:hypothetical protein